MACGSQVLISSFFIGKNRCSSMKKLVEKRDHFSEAIKLHMLQNAVHAVPEL
jgi:hypothetical protein